MDEESKKPTVIVSIPGVTILPPVEDETGELSPPPTSSDSPKPVAKVGLTKRSVQEVKTYKRVEGPQLPKRSSKVTQNDVAEHMFFITQPGQVGVLNNSETKSVFLGDKAQESVLSDEDIQETWVPTNHLDRRPGEDDIKGWANYFYALTYEVASDRMMTKLMAMPALERVEFIRVRREKHQQKLLERARKASREAVAGESRVGAITVAGSVALFIAVSVIFSPDKTRASSENALTAATQVEPKSEADPLKVRNERYQNYCPDEYLVSLKYDGVIEAGDAQGKCTFAFTHAADKLRHEDELAAQRPAPVIEEVKAEAPDPEATVPELVAPPAPAEEPRTEVFREDCERVGAVSIPMLKFEREAFKEQGVAIWRRLNFQKIMRTPESKAFLCETGEGGAEAMMLRRYCGQLARAGEKIFAGYLPTTEANLRNLRLAKASGCGN